MNDDKDKTEFVPETPEWAEQEQTDNSWNIPGITTIPCAKFALMNGIGASFVAGIGYNLAFSRRPTFVVPIVCLTTHIGSWFYCRYNYWKSKSSFSSGLHSGYSQNLIIHSVIDINFTLQFS